MKFILGGVLEYRNADCRLQHIHEHDVTSSLRDNRGEKGFLDSSVYFLFFLENKHRNRPKDARTVSVER